MGVPDDWRAGARRLLRQAALGAAAVAAVAAPGGAIVAFAAAVVWAWRRGDRRWGRGRTLGLVVFAWSALLAGTAYAQSAPIGGKGYDLLPAWRWGPGVSTRFEANLGAKDAGDSILLSIAEVAFSIAGLIWSALLWVARLAAGDVGTGGSSIVKDLVTPINDGFASVGEAIMTSGVWAAVAVLGVVIALAKGLKTGGAGVAKSLVTVILPLSLLSVMATAARGGTDQRLSPGWIADKAAASVVDMGDAVTDGFEKATLPDQPPNDMASCERYIRRLHEEYASGQSPAMAAQVSTLWERAYLAQWRNAQFSSGPIGKRVDCRLLELRNSTPRQEQDRLSAAAGAPGPTGGKHLNVYGPDRDKKDKFRRQVAWAACRASGGGWAVADEFREVDEPPVVPEHCDDWWQNGDTKPDPDNGRGVPVFQFQGGWGDDAVARRTNGGDGAKNAKDARDYLYALNGHNGGYGLVMGVLAIAIAWIFLKSVGGLAFGMLLAQFGLVVGVVMLPLLLVAWAWPTEGSTKIAVKTAKLLA
ncbi:MAG: hypothetical protein ABR540_12530, partial [Acidimicrobiales bacterium]